MLQRLNIRSKLLLTVAVPIVLLLGVAAIALPTFQNVKVNGPQYNKIRLLQDLRADVLPPPAYILEAHATVANMLNTLGRDTDAQQFADAKEKLATLEHQYRARHAYWDKTLRDKTSGDKALRDSLLVQSYLAGNAYWKTLDTQFLPIFDTALRKGYKYGNPKGSPGFTEFSGLQSLYSNFLNKQYEQHRAAIDKVVSLTESQATVKERSVKSQVSRSLLVLALAAALALALAAGLGSAVARSISRPIRRLTKAADDAASEGLPRIVAEVQSTGRIVTAPQIEIGSKDELGELASSLNAMQSTAVSLAADQALLRRNVSENLVNLGRRNQVLLGRTLNFVTQLEESERDPKRLDELFRLDHLATRMRRNAESLLVLAGSEPPRMWSEPVEVGDVVRAALSEIEEYHRVELTSLEGGSILGTAVSDVSHLLAELLENATSFSPPTSKVSVLGKRRSDGYLLVIVDEGFGMTKEEMEAANVRIGTPSAFETTPSKVLGLQVVGKLAERHNIRVELTESFAVGVAARVLLPESLFDTGPAPRPDSPSSSIVLASAGSLRHRSPDLSILLEAQLGSPGPAESHVTSEFDRSEAVDQEAFTGRANDESTTPSWMSSLVAPTTLPSRTRKPRLDGVDESVSHGSEETSVLSDPLFTDLSDDDDPFSAFETVGQSSDFDANGVEASNDRSASITEDFPTSTPTTADEEPPERDLVVPSSGPATTAGGLRRRTPGAQLPDTGPEVVKEEDSTRDPSAVRNLLGGLQRSLEGARRGDQHES